MRRSCASGSAWPGGARQSTKNLTGLENLTMVGRLCGMSRAAEKCAVPTELLERFELL